MKKFYLLTKTLLVMALLSVGASNAWGDTTVVGQTNNQNSGYYNGSGTTYARYTLAPGKQIKIEFTVSTATDDQVHAVDAEDTWRTWYAWAVNFWDGTLNAITVEARDYGWEDKTDNNRWTANWAKYWAQNYPDGWSEGDAFRDIIDGATVVTTMKRVGNQVIIIYDITTTGGEKYRQYAVKEYGGGSNTITFDLVVNHAHITIDNEKTVTTDTDAATGTLIGNLNRCTGFTDGASHKEDFVIEPNGTLNLKFRNYSAGVYTWQSWMFEMLYNGKYCNMVAGNNNQWGDLRDGVGTFNNVNWPSNILEQMEGALVDLTIVRSGADVTVTAVHTPVSGDDFTLKYSFTSAEDGFATSDANVHLISDCGYLDLLPVTKTITEAGWATYCSPYALDFSGDITNLEGAYIITGNSGATLTLSDAINTTVPANTGLLLKGEGEVNIPIVGSGAYDVSGNKLVGKTAEYELAANGGYVLLNGDKGVGFYINETEIFTVGANTAYLPKANVSAARSAYFFNGITGVENVEAATAEAAQKDGKFIENGKLIIYKNGAKYNANGTEIK